MRALACLLALAAALAGCGASGERAEVRAVVERFYAAVRADRADAACRELSEAAARQLAGQSGQPCAAVVTRLDYDGGRVVEAHVYAVSAKVDLAGGESAFLSREPAGWRLTAVACRPERGPPREEPYDCELEA